MHLLPNILASAPKQLKRPCAGVDVTKTSFVYFSVIKIFDIAKANTRPFKSQPNLTNVAARHALVTPEPEL